MAQGAINSYRQYCFAAGTPLLTPDGDKMIELFRKGDKILSAPDWDANAPTEVQIVEEVFEDFAPVVTLRIRGKDIRTTLAHRFCVWNKGWIPCGELTPGDRIKSHDGEWYPVESVTDTGEVIKGYNLRVSEYSTYFVGSRDWRFSVWAHNDYTGTRALFPYEAFEYRARAWARGNGERTLMTRRGQGGNGFDFISWTGTGANARLIINEVKDRHGTVNSATALGVGEGGRRIANLNVEAAVSAINRARGRGRIDDFTARILIQQLADRTARVRLIGNQDTDFSRVRSLIRWASGFRTLPGPDGEI